jgi:hypothetical protein
VLPGSGTLSAANNTVSSATDINANVQKTVAGVKQMTEGDLVGGAIATGTGLVDTTKSVVSTANGVVDTSKALGVGQNSRLVQKAEKLATNMGEKSVAGARLTAAGGILAAGAGAMQVYNGIKEIQNGDKVQGALTIASGLTSMAQGVGTAAQALAPAGKLAVMGGTRAVPLLGAAAGALQTAQALAKDPPDYAKAATGAMTAVGSALMLVPPAGTVVGGAMVAAAAVIDNWDSIAAGANAIGGKTAEAVNAVGETAASAAKAAGDAAIAATKSITKSLGKLFGW